jgi:hypothetical protein
VFPEHSHIGPFGTKWAFLHPENYVLQEVILEKLTQLSQGTNVLHAPPANIGGFHWTDNFISSTYLIRLIWNSMRLSPPRKLWFAGSIPLKNYLISHRKTMH